MWTLSGLAPTWTLENLRLRVIDVGKEPERCNGRRVACVLSQSNFERLAV
jgi:hypothetical protein